MRRILRKMFEGDDSNLERYINPLNPEIVEEIKK
jgi:hypothetical protein